MKNALNNQVGMLGDMFLWLVANLKQGVIYFIKQALPPNKSAGSVIHWYGMKKSYLDTPFENAQRWMGKNTFHFLLLNDDNMIGEH